MSSTFNGWIDMATRLKISQEQWNRLRWQLMCDLRVAIPAVIQSFDAEKQTVTVQPAIRENMLFNSVPTPQDLPPLKDIPIIIPRAGGFSITLPVTAGDECLVVFADMCIDAWWQSGGTSNVQPDRRRHDLSDGFAILGCWSQPSVLTSYETDSLQIRSDDGNKVIEVADDAINISVFDSSPVNIVTQGGKITATSDTEIDLTAPVIKISGGGTIIDGKTFLGHAHVGVTTGGGTSGPVF
jgi:hypothetical protein